MELCIPAGSVCDICSSCTSVILGTTDRINDEEKTGEGLINEYLAQIDFIYRSKGVSQW